MLGLALLTVAALFTTATVANAAPYRLDGLGASCTEPGASNTAHGNGFSNGASVSVVVGSTTVATLTADSSGVVDGAFTVPKDFPVGQTSVKLMGPSAAGTRTLTFQLQVGNCSPSVGGIQVSAASAGGTSGASSATGGLAFTGGNTGMVVGIAAALLLLGGAFVVAARRKRNRQAA